MSRYLSGRRAAALAPLATVALLSLWWAHNAATADQMAPEAVAVTASVPAFTPRVALATTGQEIDFTNGTGQDLRLTTTPHNPAHFSLVVPAGGNAHLTLTRPGLYHFYDAATARVIDRAAGNDVVRALPGAPNSDLPLQGWIILPGAGGVPLHDYIDVPNGNDLLDPLVAAVRVGGSITIHNHDTDPHNIVTDPADPTGIAFELLGTDGEPAIHGAERRITFTEPGLYHVYCSIHTMIMGRVGQWQVVMPRDSHATGYADHNPMESWFLVTP